ncbi:MAG: DNA replication protein DnaC [Myxococcota bacterium]|jgi:DNA replication protein DnaC
MRLGVVPETDLDAYTVGQPAALSVVDSDFESVAAHGGAVRAFLGDYGTGKTHMLELVTQRALSKGFLTATATLDAVEVAPSHPQRVVD